MLGKVVAEPLLTYPFDGLADPIDVDPVIPFFAGIEDERKGERRVLTRDDSWNGLCLHVSAHLGIPDVVDEASSMGEQMAERDLLLGWSQSRFAGRIKAFEHLWGREFGQNVFDRIVERELTSLDKLHRRSRGN